MKKHKLIQTLVLSAVVLGSVVPAVVPGAIAGQDTVVYAENSRTNIRFRAVDDKGNLLMEDYMSPIMNMFTGDNGNMVDSLLVPSANRILIFNGEEYEYMGAHVDSPPIGTRPGLLPDTHQLISVFKKVGTEAAEPANYVNVKRTFAFVSGTAGKDVPAEVLALLPKTQYFAPNVAAPPYPSVAEGTTVAADDGVWRLSNYKSSTDLSLLQMIMKEDEVVTGEWRFEPNKHGVNYVFESRTEGQTLPAEVQALLPVSYLTYVTGETVPATTMTRTSVKVSGGTWKFAGFDATEKTVNGGPVTFTGGWTYEADPAPVKKVNLRLNLVSGGSLIKSEVVTVDSGSSYDLSDKVPATVQHEGKYYRYPTHNTVSDSVRGTATEDLFIEFNYERYIPADLQRYTKYAFVSGTVGKVLPTEVTSLLVTDAKVYEDGQKVYPTHPRTKTVTVADGTWTFTGYDHTVQTFAGKNVTFTGTWTFTEKATPLPPVLPINTVVPVYRFYNKALNKHMYTRNLSANDEREKLEARGYRFEGTAWKTETTKGDLVYRLFNPKTDTYFYTRNMSEVEKLKARNWKFEGTAFRSYGTTPIYRFYNKRTGLHIYTGRAEEIAKLKAHADIRYEGFAWYGIGL